MADGKPIFYDEERRRWRRTRRVLEISGALFAFVVVVFVINVLRKPDLPELLLPYTRPLLRGIRGAKNSKLPVVRHGRKKRVSALGQVPDHYDPLRAAFYESWGPQRLRFASTTLSRTRLADSRRTQVHFPRWPARCCPRCQNPRLDALHWHRAAPDAAACKIPMASSGTSKKCRNARESTRALRALIRLHLQYALAQHFAGIALDFELVPDASQNNFQNFVKELAKKLHAQNLKLMVALPAADWAYDYKGIAQASDAVILMNYDQHWLSSPLRSDRGSGLVSHQSQQDSAAGAARKVCHGHRQLRLRLAREIEERSSSHRIGFDFSRSRSSRDGVGRRCHFRSRFAQPALFL